MYRKPDSLIIVLKKFYSEKLRHESRRRNNWSCGIQQGSIIILVQAVSTTDAQKILAWTASHIFLISCTKVRSIGTCTVHYVNNKEIFFDKEISIIKKKPDATMMENK